MSVDLEIARTRMLLTKVDNPASRRVVSRRLRTLERKRLADSIRACRKCELGRLRGHSVPMDGTVDTPDLVIVGEAPGANEDRQGKPFVGRSGKSLDKALTKVGTSRDRCVVLNTLCCRPPGNADPTSEQLLECRPWFDAQIRLAGGVVGVTLGGYAYSSVIGQPRNLVRVETVRGKAIWKDGMIWVPTWHPAYGLRKPEAANQILTDLQYALTVRWSEKRVPAPDRINQSFAEGTNLEVLKKKGWTFGYSEIVGCQIVIVASWGKWEKKPPKIPKALENLPRYTTDEVVRMTAGSKIDRQLAQSIHLVKHELDGTVIW